MPTELLGLPYILASQSQKEVTHNEALDMIDGKLGTRYVELMGGFTPAGTGADAHEFYIPTSAGVSITLRLKNVIFRQGITGSSTSTIRVQKSTVGNAAFGSGTDMLAAALSITSSNYQASTSSMASDPADIVASGNKIRIYVDAIGTGAGNWTVILEFEEVQP